MLDISVILGERLGRAMGAMTAPAKDRESSETGVMECWASHYCNASVPALQVWGCGWIFHAQVSALARGDTIRIKQMENIVGARVRIISDSQGEFPRCEADIKDIRIIGQVIWFARESVPR